MSALVVALGRAADALELLAEDRRALSRAAETVGRVPMLAAVVVARTANVGKVLGDLLGELDDADGNDVLHLDVTALRGDIASWDATAKRLDEAVTALRGRAADLLDATEAPDELAAEACACDAGGPCMRHGTRCEATSTARDGGRVRCECVGLHDEHRADFTGPGGHVGDLVHTWTTTEAPQAPEVPRG